MTAQGLQAIRAVGGVVPPALLARIQAGEVGDPASLSPASYHLAGRETIGDATSRAWSYLRAAWSAWREHTAAQPPAGAGTGPARERWLLVLLRELGYGHVPPVPGGYLIEDREYPISHAWQHVPIHLLGPGADLDRRNPGVAGAARAPQAMVQELLNRDEDRLWAILSNAVRLRLLRDSTALAGSAYLEFDLEAIFDGELYPEFRLMWQLCHVSRLDTGGRPEASPAECLLETWRNEAVDAGARALDRLRDGVEQALTALGAGFLRHPGNEPLRAALRDGRLTTSQYHRALLRLVYRLLFCFVAEDRGALLSPAATTQQRDRYARYFSTARLRRLARVRAGGPHGDLWEAQRLVLSALGNHGNEGLGLPGLAGLFDPDPRVPVIGSTTHPDLLLGCSLANSDLLKVARHLGWLHVPGRPIQPVDYRHLGTEELGSVYESLLELRPQLDLEDRAFRLQNLAGNERKTTGSYYTPTGLVSALLDTALDPLLDEAVKNAADTADAEQRLLALTICDPACGSGHFLVAAARRIAQRLAQLRSGEDEPTTPDVQHALREVAGRCIYGVDVNDLAAELAKVSLWLEALEPGKPLSFLDARIRVGNSLLGATPALIQDGVPEAAFKELEGDDKQYAAKVRRRNRTEAAGQGVLIFGDLSNVQLAADRSQLLALTDDVDQVRSQAQRWSRYEQSAGYLTRKTHADAWCAAFVWPLRPDAPEPPTNGVLQAIGDNAADPHLASIVDETERLTKEYRFFEWHLEFPEVFHVGDENKGSVGPEGWAGGFSCLVGNPPWERVKLQEQEFFAARDPDIADAPNAAARRRTIAALAASASPADRALHAEFVAARRHAEGESAILRTSGRYPLAGRGDVNTYAVFAEAFRSLTAPNGRSGVIVPTGIATDATTQHFFKDIVEKRALAALYDFENATPIFADVHRSYKFCLLTMAGRLHREEAASFAFFLHDPEMIASAEFSLTPAEINLLNPNTGTCPVFRNRRDARLALAAARRFPIMCSTSSNVISISQRVTRFGELSDLDRAERSGNATRQKDTGHWIDVYEAKLIQQYDHRFATYSSGGTTESVDHMSPFATVAPRLWLRYQIAEDHYGSSWPRWVVGYRDIARATDERTMIAAALPAVASDYTVRHLRDGWHRQPLLLAVFNTFIYDYLIRLRNNSTHLSDYITYQVPIPPDDFWISTPNWSEVSLEAWLRDRILELSWTAWDLEPFAHSLDDKRPPFRWDPERRAILRSEIDAAFLHVYGLSRDDADYIMDSFTIVRRKEEDRYGEFRTKRLILEIYDAMQVASDTGASYQTVLDPPAGNGRRHPERTGEAR